MIIGPTMDANSFEISTIDRSHPRFSIVENCPTMLAPAGLVGAKPIPNPITMMQITGHILSRPNVAAMFETLTKQNKMQRNAQNDGALLE